MAAPAMAAAMLGIWFFSVGPGAQDTPSPLMLLRPFYQESKKHPSFRGWLKGAKSRKDESNLFSKSIDDLGLPETAAAALAVVEYTLDLLPQPMMQEFTESIEDLKFLSYLLR